MPCTFIFVRHGESRKGTNERGNTADLGLTETGVAQATAAGEWIVDLGLQVAAGFRDLDGLHRKLNQWTRKNPAKVVLFCGHHSSQQALTRAFGLGLQSRERGVVVVGLPTGEPSVMAITPS
jgi:bisphosphoglycerate-dependent phosphoglycerate mutase